MAVAHRDVISILQEGEAAIQDWDGYGVPPDGGNYAEKTDGEYFWIVCLSCNGKGADKPHCCSDGHRKNLRAHVERTIRTSASAATPPAAVPRAEAMATTVVIPKAAPPPPPSHEPLDSASSLSPPPQLPTTQDLFEKQEKRIKDLAATINAMNTKLDAIMAALGRLSAGPEPRSDRAATAEILDAPASAAAQQRDRGTWASSGPAADASWSADVAAQQWHEWTQWPSAASRDTPVAATSWQ